jgi:hypothetical protein
MDTIEAIFSVDCIKSTVIKALLTKTIQVCLNWTILACRSGYSLQLVGKCDWAQHNNQIIRHLNQCPRLGFFVKTMFCRREYSEEKTKSVHWKNKANWGNDLANWKNVCEEHYSK